MENILNKKVSCPLWAVIAIVTFITLGAVTGNITVSENFITVIKLITIIVAGTIAIVAVAKVLLNYKDSIIEFFKINNIKMIIALIITLIATLLSGCMYQVSIGAMNETVLNNIIVIEFSAVLFVFTATITNIIKLLNTKKTIKRKARMKKLASLIARQNIATITPTNNTVKIKALVTDLYSLSVQDVIVEENMDARKLYKSENFMSLLNETVSVTKDLGCFENSFNTLVSNHYISTMEAATAKVVTFSVDREILKLL